MRQRSSRQHQKHSQNSVRTCAAADVQTPETANIQRPSGERVEPAVRQVLSSSKCSAFSLDSDKLLYSCKHALQEPDWALAHSMLEEGKVHEVQVKSVNRGGLRADLAGIEGFLPYSKMCSGLGGLNAAQHYKLQVAKLSQIKVKVKVVTVCLCCYFVAWLMLCWLS